MTKHSTTIAFFGINDKAGEARPIGVKVHSEDNNGLAISLDDHSTNSAADGFDDAILWLEYEDGKPTLYVFADINSEEPTHKIDLSGAHINRRK